MKLQESLGQSFVVDNRSGAGGTLGTEIVARAAPDGATLVMVNAGHVINPHLYKALGYDTIRSFAPVALAGTASYVLVVHPSVPARSVKELQLADVKKRLLEAEGADPAAGSAAEFAQFIGSELKKYGEIVRISGARLD